MKAIITLFTAALLVVISCKWDEEVSIPKVKKVKVAKKAKTPKKLEGTWKFVREKREVCVKFPFKCVLDYKRPDTNLKGDCLLRPMGWVKFSEAKSGNQMYNKMEWNKWTGVFCRTKFFNTFPHYWSDSYKLTGKHSTKKIEPGLGKGFIYKMEGNHLYLWRLTTLDKNRTEVLSYVLVHE